MQKIRALLLVAQLTAALLQVRGPFPRRRSLLRATQTKSVVVVFDEDLRSERLAAKVAASIRAKGFEAVASPEIAQECGCVVDVASRTAAAAAERTAAAAAERTQRYVLASSSEVFGDDQVECLPTTQPALKEHPLRQAEQTVLGSCAETVVVRAPERTRVDSSNFEDATLLRYFCDRFIGGQTVVPVPWQWRDMPLALVREEDVVDVLARVATSDRVPESQNVVHAAGAVDEKASLRTGTLLQLARASAICAGLDVARVPQFNINSVWLRQLDFPLSRRDFKVLGDVALDSAWLFPERPPPKQLPRGFAANARLRKRQTKKVVDEKQDRDDMIRLVAALAPFYDAYRDSALSRRTQALDADDLPFAKDEDFRYDGEAQEANTVYMNDEFHFKLGPSRDDNPILLAAAAKKDDVAAPKFEEW